MRVVIQRVSSASVTIEKKEKRSIQQGLVILVGIEDIDTEADAEWLSGKIAKLRIFDDEQGVMNRCINDINGEILLVSQFTLHASYKKGNRPSYIRASKPDKAIPLYNFFIKSIEKETGKQVKTGEFGTMMLVDIQNDGPVTILMDTANKE